MKWSATFVRRTALLGMVGCLLSGSPAQTQVAGIVGTLGTGMIVDKIGDKLNSLIDKARTSADFLAMRAAQEALYVLDAFKATNQELLDDAFDRIGEERQAILNAINTTVTEIEAGRVDTLERLQATTDQIDRLARTVTFRSYPVIFRYRGSIVTPGETGDIRIAVDGSNLNKGVSHLKFQDKKYDAKVEGEMLRFDIPRAAFAPDDKSMKSEDAELVLEYRHGGIFGYGQTVEEVKYHLNVITLPKQLAVVEAAYNEFVMIPRERSVAVEVAHNSSSGSWDCLPFAYSPSAADRRFHPDHSRVTPGSGNSRGQLRSVSVRDVGISFQICARRGTFDKDNGFRHAHVAYLEVWKERDSQPRTFTGELTWTGSIPIKLPDDIGSLTVRVRDFTGNHRDVTTVGGAAGQFATVRYDAQSDVAIVDPVVPRHLGDL